MVYIKLIKSKLSVSGVVMYWGIWNRVVVGILVDYEYVLFKVWLFNSMINKI